MKCPNCNQFLDKYRDEWFDVSFFLYLGVIKIMDYYAEDKTRITEEKYNELKKAVDIYINRCVVSAESIKENFEKVRAIKLVN